MEVNFQIYHYWCSQCAMKGVKTAVKTAVIKDVRVRYPRRHQKK